MRENTTYTHSVTLIPDLCTGCTNCIKRCPTEAIRVRDKKAYIIRDRCIDCGECIRVCPRHAKKAISNQLADYSHFKHLVALPAPTLYAQFNNLSSTSQVVSALLDIGFDSCYEVAKAAEIVSEATEKLFENMPKPVLSSACPAVVRLIKVRFPELVNNVLPLVSPMELSARLAKKEISEKYGLKQEDIGCIFITPCPAKITDIKSPIGSSKSFVDGAVAIKDIYAPMLNALKKPIHTAESTSGKVGLRWASCGGESTSLRNLENHLSCDGIQNVLSVLSDLEDQKFANLEFVELNACPAGCVGGVLTIENPYIAKTKLTNLRKNLPETTAKDTTSIPPEMLWNTHLVYDPVFELKGNITEKLKTFKDIEDLLLTLPGLDCGSCGAPTCKAFAQDVIENRNEISNCVVIMKEKMEDLLNSKMEKEVIK